MDNKHILEMEEKEVMSSVGTVLSHLCGPGEWMPVRKLHTEVCDCKTCIYSISAVSWKG